MGESLDNLALCGSTVGSVVVSFKSGVTVSAINIRLYLVLFSEVFLIAIFLGVRLLY